MYHFKAIRFMYKYKFNPNSQPKAIYDLIFDNSNIKHRNTRESNDQNKN